MCSKVQDSHNDLMLDGILTTAVMERDRRLTGFIRGQTDKAEAPAGFELNNPWRVRISVAVETWMVLTNHAVRAAILLSSAQDNRTKANVTYPIKQYQFLL